MSRWSGVLGASYGRMSADPDDLKLGTGRQESDNEDVAERAGIELYPDPLTGKRSFVDDNISASRFNRKPRPAYRRLLQAIEDHDIRVIIVWHIDRFLRRNDELEDVITLALRLGQLWVITPTMEFDLTDDFHQTMLRMIVSMAGQESANISRRGKRERLEARKAGIAGPGTIYGWTGDGTTVVTHEADHIEWMVEELLDGEAVAQLARRLNDDGVPTKTGKGKWTTSTVRNVVTHGRHYGVLTYRHPPENGKPAWVEVLGPAKHRGFLKREKYDQVLATMAGRRGRSGPKRQTSLTGLVHCGRCGATMSRNQERVRPGRNQTDRRPILSCRPTATKPACGKRSIDADIVESVVLAAVFERVDHLALKHLAEGTRNQTNAGALAVRLAELDAEVDTNVAAHRSKKISTAAFRSTDRQIEAERDEINRQLRRLSTNRVLRPYAGKRGALARDWDHLSVTIQRAVITEVLRLAELRIEIGPHEGPRNQPDPFRVKLLPKTERAA